jgi:hypothetical protein
MFLDDAVRYENEHTGLDFKTVQYDKLKFSSFLKDVIAMANAHISGPRFIIVGIKVEPDGSRTYHSIPPGQFVDDAIYQQLVRENIEPEISLAYEPYKIEENVLGVFTIDGCTDRPYMMKKDFANLRKGDMFIRKGSSQDRLTRTDLDRILASKKTSSEFIDKVHLGFNESMDTSTELPGLRNHEFPSQKAECEIREVLESRKNSPQSAELLFPILSIGSAFSGVWGHETPYSQMTTEDLKLLLPKVREKYQKHDEFDLVETQAQKINLWVLNNGERYLEDVTFELHIPKIPGIFIPNRILDDPKESLALLAVRRPIHSPLSYPTVKEEESRWVVFQSIGDLRHKIKTKVFQQRLRITFFEVPADKLIPVMYFVHARNLEEPLIGSLEIKIT